MGIGDGLFVISCLGMAFWLNKIFHKNMQPSGHKPQNLIAEEPVMRKITIDISSINKKSNAQNLKSHQQRQEDEIVRLKGFINQLLYFIFNVADRIGSLEMKRVIRGYVHDDNEMYPEMGRLDEMGLAVNMFEDVHEPEPEKTQNFDPTVGYRFRSPLSFSTPSIVLKMNGMRVNKIEDCIQEFPKESGGYWHALTRLSEDDEEALIKPRYSDAGHFSPNEILPVLISFREMGVLKILCHVQYY